MMLNKDQKKAVSHLYGPAIVLAGPGSGKTTVIIERIKNLINHQIPPGKILVVTFTKAAAMHMKQRFCDEMNAGNINTFPVTFATFHSIFFRMIKDEYGYRADSIITESQKADYIKQCVIRLKIDTPSLADYMNAAASEIGKIKSNGIDIATYESLSCGTESFKMLYREYHQCLKSEGKLDFDDILQKTYEMFINHPMVLKQWQQTYEYILIDEFQDINYLQYEIIKLLAGKKQNLFVVGDDDQSIYGFRGARPDIMLHFKDDFVDAREIHLNINYRCGKEIVKHAGRLISHNQVRFSKDLVANNGHGKISVRQFKNQGEEIEYIIKQIRTLKRQGIREEQIAILVRNNSQVPVFRTALTNSGFKNQIKNNTDSLYSGMIAKDIFAYIGAALFINQTNAGSMYLNENEDLIFVLNKPNRLISREVVLQEEMTFEKLKNEYRHSAEVRNSVESLKFHLNMIAKLTPYAAINYIKKGVGYEDYLAGYAKEHHLKPAELMRQLDKIHQEAYGYKNYRNWFNFIENEKCRTDIVSGINILTMHGAKGLEFHTVIIPDVNQGIIPSKRIIREKDFEEERRVFYVAMTRAKEQLCIYGITEILGCSMEMSMFVGEIF